jgi:glycosyltransferase involved in cell wall biosynthesis
LRVLILNWRDAAHAGAGGAEVWAHRIGEHWAAEGHDVTFFASAVPNKPTLENSNGVKIVRRGSRFTVYREARKFWKENDRSFDAVVESVNTVPFMCPKWVGKTPLVTMIHQLAKEVWRHEAPWPVALAGRYVLEPHWLKSYADARVITNSQSGAESFAAYGMNNVSVIPTGMELPAQQSRRYTKEAVPTVIFCGRLASNKRPVDALEAFKVLRSKLPNAQMWIVGAGDQEALLRRKAGPGVKFFGYVPREKKFELMARAHALLVTSVREGWGLVVTEAGAMGTSTVAYDVAGLRDSVPAANGILVPPAPQSMGNKLIELLPRWTTAYDQEPRPGGVLPWADVADRVLQSTGVPSGKPTTIDLTSPAHVGVVEAK